jgi:hypothetical protein
MDEKSWSDCVDRNTARRITPNPAKGKSLISTAEKRKTFISKQQVKRNP